MSSGRNKVEAGMNSCVRNHLLPVNSHLLIKVLVKLLIDVLNDGNPAIRKTDY